MFIYRPVLPLIHVSIHLVVCLAAGHITIKSAITKKLHKSLSFPVLCAQRLRFKNWHEVLPQAVGTNAETGHEVSELTDCILSAKM